VTALALEDFLPQGETALALGFFDGVHLGHQAVLKLALSAGGRPWAYTFRNHPASVLAPERAPRLLTTFAERVEILEGLGLGVVYSDFDLAFSQISPRRFAEEILAGRLGARWVAVGANYTFGHQGAGKVALLAELGRQLGFEVRTAGPVRVGGRVVSSTRIRQAVAGGRVEEARQLLGRPYQLRGEVVPGAARGARLGFPTANLRPPAEKVLPAHGVYAVLVRYQERLWPGVANLGVRPTFGEDQVLLEVHLFDVEVDLYGQELEVHFIRRLRPERKFPGVEALRAQIAEDCRQARELLGALGQRALNLSLSG
jgi:riboflavin kinase/FMN adenylyltransferase